MTWKQRFAAIWLVVSLIASGWADNYQQRPQSDRGLTTVRSGAALDGRGRLWAVVIGVSSYQNLSPDQQLRFAHRDAQEFAAFLRSPYGGGFPSNQLKLLVNQEATLSAIRTAMGTWLPRSAEPGDVAYIFFAGHGVVEGERDGYLLPYDADPQNLYATALPIAEVDRIITERIKARTIILMADACHAGRLGWAARNAEQQMLVNRYLEEVGKSGAGVFRLLGSRATERSFEDPRWGGGHGVFTYFLLQGLRGKADSDQDGMVRAAELLDYLSRVVPEETQALQHPRAAGSVEPRLPLAVLRAEPARDSLIAASQLVVLEVHGTPGSEVYLNNAYRGRIRPSGVLVIEGIRSGSHEVSIDPPNAEAFTQTIALAAARTILDLRAILPERAASRSSPLVAQIRQAIDRQMVLEPGGAWTLFQQLIRETPAEPQRASLEIALSRALEEIGQQAINNYIHAPISQLRRDMFHRAAQAFTYLKSLSPADPQLEARRLFCEGRALIVESKPEAAIALLEQSISLDPKAAHAYNALGVAYEARGKNDKARESFTRAAQLAPQWSLPRFHLGLLHYARGQRDKSERELQTAVQLDPRYPYLRWHLARLYREQARYAEAERELLELLRFTPGYSLAYAELGLIYEANRLYDKACAAFNTYLQLEPQTLDREAVSRRKESVCERANRRAPSLKRP